MSRSYVGHAEKKMERKEAERILEQVLKKLTSFSLLTILDYLAEVCKAERRNLLNFANFLSLSVKLNLQINLNNILFSNRF